MNRWIVLFLIAPLYALNVFAGESLVIRGATVWDGTGAPAKAQTDIEIIDGKITRIGASLKSKVKNVIEADGLFVMPALIDSHTHLRSIPGSAYRPTLSEDALKKERLAVTKSYLAAGVTTVLDCAAPASLFLESRERKEDDARVLGLAPFITPATGYFSGENQRGQTYKDLWPAVQGPEDFGKLFDLAQGLGAPGAKVTMEGGFGPFQVWPTFDAKMRQALAREASRRGIPLFVHSMTEEEHRLALTLKPYALVHAGFAEAPANERIIKELKDSGVYVITTAAILKLTLLMFEPEKLDEPWIQRLVPAEQITTAQDKKLRHQIAVRSVLEGSPWWIPKFLSRFAAPYIFSERMMKRSLSTMQKSLKMMHDAGVPLVMGSDSGNWPVWTSFFHGVGAILEMEALEESGIPREDILIMATSRPAQMLRIDKETGTIEAGKSADLLILKKDPREGFSALKDPAYTVRAGHARTPEQWMN